MISFDYEIPHTCQREVASPSPGRFLDYACDCGKPAPVRGWWGDGSDEMWLCETHLQEILAKEAQNVGA